MNPLKFKANQISFSVLFLVSFAISQPPFAFGYLDPYANGFSIIHSFHRLPLFLLLTVQLKMLGPQYPITQDPRWLHIIHIITALHICHHTQHMTSRYGAANSSRNSTISVYQYLNAYRWQVHMDLISDIWKLFIEMYVYLPPLLLLFCFCISPPLFFPFFLKSLFVCWILSPPCPVF